MKSIGWCLERIQIAMAHIPRDLHSVEDKKNAENVLAQVQECANTLAQLILNPRFKGYLHQLEQSSLEGVRFQAKEIEELLKDLEHMLYVLDLYLKELREIIIHRPDLWTHKADQLVLMIDQKFGGEMGELRKEFQIALHTEDELRKIVTSEEHLREFLT